MNIGELVRVEWTGQQPHDLMYAGWLGVVTAKRDGLLYVDSDEGWRRTRQPQAVSFRQWFAPSVLRPEPWTDYCCNGMHGDCDEHLDEPCWCWCHGELGDLPEDDVATRCSRCGRGMTVAVEDADEPAPVCERCQRIHTPDRAPRERGA
jgi:hypothetical protein